MAEIIKASRFYIGNMSFQYNMAEGLKIPRFLEASPDLPVVFPVGLNVLMLIIKIILKNFLLISINLNVISIEPTFFSFKFCNYHTV